jgi:hypothetical protein
MKLCYAGPSAQRSVLHWCNQARIQVGPGVPRAPQTVATGRLGLLAVEMDPQEVYAGMVDAAGILEDLAKDMLEAGLAKDELKTEADPLELIRADLAIQLEDDVAEPAESEAIRSNVRQSLDEVKQLSSLCIWKQRSDTLSQNLDHL